MTDHLSIATDLDALRSGGLSVSDFRHKYAVSDSVVLNAIWDNLQHYLDDDVIRARDDSYSEMQDNELRKLISLLRQGAPLAQLCRISLLAET